jgi:hypothetical protein
MPARPRPKHESAVAIGTFDEGLVAHFKIDPRMAERATAPIAGYAGVVHFDDFGRFDRHGSIRNLWREGIIMWGIPHAIEHRFRL